MSVEIDPQELGFRRPFTVEVSQLLKLKNTNKSPVAFKVKTTAPKQYCVRPNSGRIEPGHEVEVTVLLQAMKQDPPLDTKCRDKFLVQSVLISGDKDFTSVQQIWDGVPKSDIQERKIRVNFLAAGSTDGVAATPLRHLANGVENTPDQPPPAYSSPGDELRSPQAYTPTPALEPAAKIKEEEPDHSRSAMSSPQSYNEPGKEDLKSDLAAANAEINTANNEEGLRQRKGVTGTGDVPRVAEIATAVRPKGTEGVPIQIVAVLCLVSFLLAYFLF